MKLTFITDLGMEIPACSVEEAAAKCPPDQKLVGIVGAHGSTARERLFHSGLNTDLSGPMKTPDVPVNGMTVRPLYYPGLAWNTVLGSGWITLCQYMLTQKESREQFTKDTGKRIESIFPRSPIESALIEHSGFGDSMMAVWCDWVTKTAWGVAS